MRCRQVRAAAHTLFSWVAPRIGKPPCTLTICTRFGKNWPLVSWVRRMVPRCLPVLGASRLTAPIFEKPISQRSTAPERKGCVLATRRRWARPESGGRHAPGAADRSPATRSALAAVASTSTVVVPSVPAEGALGLEGRGKRDAGSGKRRRSGKVARSGDRPQQWAADTGSRKGERAKTRRPGRISIAISRPARGGRGSAIVACPQRVGGDILWFAVSGRA
jgi:hypothetical protein